MGSLEAVVLIVTCTFVLLAPALVFQEAPASPTPEYGDRGGDDA